MTSFWTWLNAKHSRKWNLGFYAMHTVLFFIAFPVSLLFSVMHFRDAPSKDLLHVVSWFVLPVWGIYYLVTLGIFAHVTRLSDRIDRLESEMTALRSSQPEPPAIG